VQAARGRGSSPSRRRKIVRATCIAIYPFYLVGLWLLAEILYWKLAFHVDFSTTSTDERVWNVFYPELRDLATEHARHAAERDRFEVLVLGGSVAGQAAPYLRSALGRQAGDRIKIHSLAMSAQTSRDSYLKYRKLANFKPDLIIIYDCINDARLNCIEPSKFRDDYSHCRWYSRLYDRLANGSPSPIAVAGERIGNSIALGIPEKDVVGYGGEVKTEAPFRRNIEFIVADASRRGIPVVLMSFAYYIPANYSRELFNRQALDYGKGDLRLPVEVWGHPAHVAKAIDIHNSVIKDIASQYANAMYVDQQSLLPKTGRIFSDVCHLTVEGCEEFARNIAEALAASRSVHTSNAASASSKSETEP
jgi:hypothetical protein